MRQRFAPSVVTDSPSGSHAKLRPWHPTVQQAVTALVVAVLTSASGLIGANCNMATKQQLTDLDAKLTAKAVSVEVALQSHVGLEAHQYEQIGIEMARLGDRVEDALPVRKRKRVRPSDE